MIHAGMESTHVESAFSVVKNCKIGLRTTLKDQVNLYNCEIGADCKIDSFVYIESGVKIGNKCKIRAFTFICEGVTIGDEVFIGSHVTFTNDKRPKATNSLGALKSESDWTLERSFIKKGASIGSNATIVGPITIGENALIGAGSVVTKDVSAGEIVAGVPARPLE